MFDENLIASLNEYLTRINRVIDRQEAEIQRLKDSRWHWMCIASVSFALAIYMALSYKDTKDQLSVLKGNQNVEPRAVCGRPIPDTTNAESERCTD